MASLKLKEVSDYIEPILWSAFYDTDSSIVKVAI